MFSNLNVRLKDETHALFGHSRVSHTYHFGIVEVCDEQR